MKRHIRDGTVGIATAAVKLFKARGNPDQTESIWGVPRRTLPTFWAMLFILWGTAIAWFLLSNLWWNEGLNQFCDHRTLSEGQLLCQTPFFPKLVDATAAMTESFGKKILPLAGLAILTSTSLTLLTGGIMKIFKTPGWLQEAIDNVAREREEEEHQQWLQQEAHRLAVEIARQKEQERMDKFIESVQSMAQSNNKLIESTNQLIQHLVSQQSQTNGNGRRSHGEQEGPGEPGQPDQPSQG